MPGKPNPEKDGRVKHLAMRTFYTFIGDGKPGHALDEPARTAVILPEEGPHVGEGVVEHIAVIGQRITRAEEVVTAARPSPQRPSGNMTAESEINTRLRRAPRGSGQSSGPDALTRPGPVHMTSYTS
jgi:hypothetical protein